MKGVHMKDYRAIMQRCLRALPAALLLSCTLIMPFAAVRARAEQERVYQVISDTMPFGETYIYKDGYMSYSEKRGSVDWMLEAMCLEPWDLKIVQENSTPEASSFYRTVDERVYRGHLSEGDTLRSSASINGINGFISTHAIVYFGSGNDFEYRISSENDYNLMDAADGDSVDSTATKSWTVFNDYTVEKGVKKVVVFIHHDGDFRGRTVTTDDAYMNIRFEFTVDKVSQSVTETADDRPGEDSGTGIIDEIIDDSDDPDLIGPIAVSFGGAAAAAAAIASGSSRDKGGDAKSSRKEKKKASRYRMYVYKNFGNAIRKDGKPVTVGARIAEIDENNKEIPRNDLTKHIQVFSEDDTLNVKDGGMSGRYRNALATAEKNSELHEGTVSFRYTGEGGTFTKNVVFRLVDEVQIVFPAMNEEGRWIANANLNETDVIAGMKGRTKLRFMFMDAVEEPEQITFSNTTGFGITAVKDSEYAYTYWAEIENRKREIQKEAGIFADMKTQKIGIHAVFPDHTAVTNEFIINIWPEGISVPMEDQKDGYIEMCTVPDENAVGSAKIPPAMFNVYVCRMNGEEAVVQKNPGMTWNGFYDDGKYGNTFKQHFPWKIYGGAGISIYAFNTLPVIIDPYYSWMILKYEEAGYKAEEKLPFRMTGIKPDLPSLARKEAALKKLKRAIEIYGLGSDPDLRNALRNAPNMSGADIEHLCYQLLLAGRTYYEADSEEFASIDAVMTRYIVVASSMVAVGDKAVEYAIQLYWPNAPADLIAAFANPFKNAMAEYLGQYVARWSWVDLTEGGNIEEFAFMKTLISSSNETLSAIITGEREVHPKVLGQIVSLYLMLSYANHYFYGEGEEKGDIFKSVMAALGDLTLTKFKQFIGNQIKDLNKKLFAKIGNYAGKLLSDQLRKGYQAKADTAGLNVFMQYVRGSYNASGKLTNEGFKAANAAKDSLKSEYMKGAEKAIEETVSQAAEAADIAIAQLLNYLCGGTLDENDALGVQTHEVEAGYIIDRSGRTARLLARGFKKCFGIDVEKAYEDTVKALEISVRLDGAYLIIKMFGYCVEINYIDNFEALFQVIYDEMFSWMEVFWTDRIHAETGYDPRDEITDDTSLLEVQKEHMEKLEKSVNITYYGK